MMGFTEGLPGYGIHDKLMPDEIALKLWVFLNPILDNMVWSGIDYVIEGEAVLPELIEDFLHRNKGKVRICFLGFTDIDITEKLKEIRLHSPAGRDWLTNEDDPYIRDHLQNMINHSALIMHGCERTNLRYFDTSEDILATVESAKDYLMKE